MPFVISCDAKCINYDFCLPRYGRYDKIYMKFMTVLVLKDNQSVSPACGLGDDELEAGTPALVCDYGYADCCVVSSFRTSGRVSHRPQED